MINETLELMTLNEFAEYINRPLNTVRHWRAQGAGPKCIRVGGRVMVSKPAVRAWLDAGQNKAS